MYTIIGGDGQEYGPVAAAQIRAWLTAGRANLDTKAKVLGTDEWRRVGDFSDFGGSVSGVSPAGSPSAASPQASRIPLPAGADARTIANDMIARAAPIDIARCYERSWNLLKAEFWPLVGMGFLTWALNQVVVVTLMGRVNLMDPNTFSRRFFVGVSVASLLGAVLWGGLEYYILKKLRGEPTTPGDGFDGFKRAFVPLVLAGLLTSVLCTIGLFVLILPGIYLWVGYRFAYLLVLDKGMEFWTAMEVSRRVITSQWWRIFGLTLLAIPFAILGLVCLFVGLFVAMPLILGAMVCAYEELCNPPARVRPSS